MKKTCFYFFTLLALSVNAQVGIGTNNPIATLDVRADAANVTTADGIIAPRLSGNQLAAKDAVYLEDLKGSLVYVTSAVTTSTAKTININSSGYYYFDGAVWQKLDTGNTTSLFTDNGTLTGNRLVTQGTNTLAFTSTATTGTSHFSVDGSTFNVDAVNNRVGIGTNQPKHSLDVRGSVYLGVMSGANTSGILRFGRRDNVDIRYSDIVVENSSNGGNNNHISFRVHTGTSYASSNQAEVMTLRGSGNVGIGTTTPTAKLDVAGAIKVGDLTTGIVPQPGMIRFNNTTNKFQGYDGTNWIDMH